MARIPHPARRLLPTIMLAAGLLYLLGSARPASPAAALAAAQDAPVQPVITGTIRVATKPLVPFVYLTGTTPSGFSIDVWQEIANRLGLDFEWVKLETVKEVLADVESGDADVGIAGISMTREREQSVDFTHPFFDAGLQILVPGATSSYSVLDALGLLFSPALLVILALGILAAFVMGNVIWLLERKDPEFPDGYFAGVWEGVWWALTVVANGEYPRKPTNEFLRRLLTFAFWLTGLVLVAQFTASVTSTLTVQKLNSSIAGPEDLPGKRIATVEGSTAASYLDAQSIQYFPVKQIDEAYAMMANGDIDAIVYDAPVLQYYAVTEGRGEVTLVGPIFKPEKYGIALHEGSPLREPINEVLLEMYQDGTLEAIHQRWFGE